MTNDLSGRSSLAGVVLCVCAFVVAPQDAVAATELPALGCTLEPSRSVAVSSPVAGVIERFDLDRGARVSEGTFLFKLHDGVERAAVDLAEIKAEFAERKLERNSDLLAEQLLSDHERDEIETEMQIAAMELRATQEQLALRTVVSPITGVVVDVLAFAGEYVTVDPVVELAQLNPLYVELLMPASWFGRLSLGQTLKVQPGEPIGGEYDADVAVIDPVIDPGSGTFRIRLQFANPRGEVPAGVSCKALLPD
jgi:membrane fusion protein (multidrug efflux system)